jgi:lysozyme family protein
MSDTYGEHSRLLKEAYKNTWTRGEFDKEWAKVCKEKADKNKEQKQKIAAAKAKLTPEELELLDLND